MVRIIDYKVRMNADEELFYALILQGGIELVKSKETGLYYATAKRASITSTFDEETCKSLVGQELDGTIQKMECEPFEFINEETGEVISLDYRWVYVKEGETVVEAAKAEQYQEELELV